MYLHSAFIEGNLRPLHPPCEYLSEYTSRGKSKIPRADQIPMDPVTKSGRTPLTMPTWAFKSLVWFCALCSWTLRGCQQWNAASSNADAVCWLTNYGSWHAYEKRKIMTYSKALTVLPANSTTPDSTSQAFTRWRCQWLQLTTHLLTPKQWEAELNWLINLSGWLISCQYIISILK